MIGRRAAVLAGIVSVLAGTIGPSAGASPRGQHHLPAAAEYGLASHLRQYPDLSLATSAQRTAAETVFEQAKQAALQYRTLATARVSGYDLHVARKPPAVLGVLHAEKKW
jgi:hypothetical protein